MVTLYIHSFITKLLHSFKDLPMPALFYVPHEDPAFDNAVSYLPADMVPKPPKRAGVAFQVNMK